MHELTSIFLQTEKSNDFNLKQELARILSYLNKCGILEDVRHKIVKYLNVKMKTFILDYGLSRKFSNIDEELDFQMQNMEHCENDMSFSISDIPAIETQSEDSSLSSLQSTNEDLERSFLRQENTYNNEDFASQQVNEEPLSNY